MAQRCIVRHSLFTLRCRTTFLCKEGPIHSHTSSLPSKILKLALGIWEWEKRVPHFHCLFALPITSMEAVRHWTMARSLCQWKPFSLAKEHHAQESELACFPFVSRSVLLSRVRVQPWHDASVTKDGLGGCGYGSRPFSPCMVRQVQQQLWIIQ